MQTSIKKQSGMTIVEVLIAGVIIAVGILGWAKTQTGAIRGRAISNGITTASILASSKAEELSLVCQSNPQVTSGYENATVNTSSPSVSYDVRWKISKETIKTTLWIIDVEVSWTHFGNKSLQYQRVVTGS